MKKIGILGGMAPESTIEYYRLLINFSRKKWEQFCPEIIIYNLNIGMWEKYILSEDSSKAISLLINGVKSLGNAGADFGIMASNTPHMFFENVSKASPIPLLSISEEVAKEAERRSFRTIGLMGTSMVMKGDFYRKAFEKRGISIIVPEEKDLEYVHNKIVGELVRGNFKDETKNEIIRIESKMESEHKIDALILGCTELPLMIREKDVNVPLLNTLEIHAKAAFEYAID